MFTPTPPLFASASRSLSFFFRLVPPLYYLSFLAFLKNFHHTPMPCQPSSPSHLVSGKVKVTATQCSPSPNPSLQPPRRHEAALAAHIMHRHDMKPIQGRRSSHTYLLSPGCTYVCEKRARRRLSLILHSDLLFQSAIVSTACH